MPESKLRFLRASGLCAIVIIAFAIRISVSFDPVEKTRYGLGPMGDSGLYHTLAFNLFSGHGYSASNRSASFGMAEQVVNEAYVPAVTRAPAYPFFLAVVYTVLGDRDAMKSVESWRVNWQRVRFVQTILDSLTCLLVYFIGRKLAPKSYIPAFVGTGFHAVAMHNAYYTREILSETLSTFLLTAFVLVFLRTLVDRRLLLSFLSGASAGLVVLCRQEFILWAVAAPVLLFLLLGKPRWVAFRSCLLMWLGALVVIAPWTMRNRAAAEETILIGRGMIGYSLFLGTFEGRVGWQGWGQWPDEVFVGADEKPESLRQHRALIDRYNQGLASASVHDDHFKQLALRTLRQDPAGCLFSWLCNAPRLWHLNQSQMYQRPEPGWAWFFLPAGFVVFAFRGADRQQWELLLAIGALVLYIAGVFFPLHIEPRYSIAVRPSIFAVAGLGVCNAISWIRTVGTEQ